ncbi:hypothetical protein GCM10011581_02180 [Saccharopolyspora subtropica]|uniref:Uncharacterized protein n=1 Tax=Saccharopolyspora thermophila TaxID=89367 RepID=A0A917JK79_9PSEU|nr:hypothetical protein [Saccharopolyspora subtropica]GGI68743.1 hypothetical protein GCM10011581_02180 [Saccharopolyspora subtropica]
MAGVEEVRAGIALANQKMQEGIAALQQTNLVLEEAQQALVSATQGSTQEEMQHAHGMLAEAMQTINGVQGTLQATIASTEGYAGRL